MFQSILEYVVNADAYYRLWMAAEMQNPTTPMGSEALKITQPRQEWLPDLVGMFSDVRDVPGVIRIDNGHHLVDSTLRFHTGNKNPSTSVGKMELFWGVNRTDVYRVKIGDDVSPDGHVITHPMRAIGPCKITFTRMQMWHHQNLINRRRGDAIIIPQIDFEWNTKKDTGGSFRANGPFKITITGFKAKYKMGVRTDAQYDNLSVSWGTENGIRIGENRVQEVINRNEIGINYLMCDSAFSDPGEEFIFWDEVGREQQAA